MGLLSLNVTLDGCYVPHAIAANARLAPIPASKALSD